jgi:ParB family transcriptional regulator, chromosome partitioning protein
MQRKALGKGLDALFGGHDADRGIDQETIEASSPGRRIVSVALSDIVPNKNQPRQEFDPAALDDLKRSIADNGILEPPVVRRSGDAFELVVGERRFRAATELGLDSIDVIVMDVATDTEMLVLALIENIQREDLNAIEEAAAYRKIMQEMDVTQERLAEIVGKSRSTVANTLRLLSLAEVVQHMVRDGELAPGSARPLVMVEDIALQVKLAKKIAAEGLSARKAEQLVKRALNAEHERHAPTEPAFSHHVESVREDLQRYLGTAVALKGTEKKGRIEIAYYSPDDLERILDAIRGE